LFDAVDYDDVDHRLDRFQPESNVRRSSQSGPTTLEGIAV
jgi:hypothetical protein